MPPVVRPAPARSDLVTDGVYATVAEAGLPALAVSRPDESDAVRVVWANHGALGLLGLTADEVIGTELMPRTGDELAAAPVWTAVVAEELLRLRAARGVDALGATGDTWIDAVLEVPDRTVAPVQLLLRPVDDQLAVVLLRSASQELRLAEIGQRESEHRFRALAEHAPVGIVVSEAGLRLGFVNARFGEIVGADPVLLTGIRWLRRVHPDDLPVLLSALDDIFAGQHRELTIRLVRYGPLDPDQSFDTSPDQTRWVQIRLAPVTTPRRSAGFIGTIEDVTDRRAWENQLSYLAEHDPLTGLANRRSLVDAMTQLLNSRRTRDHDAAVLFCDLDGFKQVNDTLGHEAGDRVLIEVGQRLVSTARDHDLVARIAGDEFVVLVREIGSAADAEMAAERQLRALQEPIYVAGAPVVVSASIGVAMAPDYTTAAELLQAADRGMYAAKRAGRGRFVRDRAGSGSVIGLAGGDRS